MKITVDDEDVGLDLLEFLSLRLLWVSKTQLRRLLGAGGVTVDGRRAGSNFTVAAGQVVELAGEALPAPDFAERIAIEVLYEDETHLAVNKPAGHTVLPTRDGSGRAFYNGLFLHLNPSWPEGERWVRPHVVHRLDCETSGVLLVGKSTEAGRRLSRQFERGRVHKTYQALMEGCPPQETFTVDLPIARKKASLLEMAIDFRKGKPSVTEMRVLADFGGFSLVEARPRTGRQHQIRVHAAAIGHPLAVDFLYGRRRVLRYADISRWAHAGLDPETPVLTRCPLHAAAIDYEDPRTRERRTVEAPLPEDLVAVVGMLGGE